MSDDIVERLRRWDDGRPSTHYDGCIDSHHVCAILWAADIIEQRDATIATLTAASAWRSEVERLRADLANERAEVERLTQLHERIAASDDVAKAYQQVYFEDFPTVKQAVTDTLLAKEQLAAERALADQLADALVAGGAKGIAAALTAWGEARRER